MSIKSTYSLDVETVRLLEQMAQRWNVPKSEALRRAIRAASGQDLGGNRPALEALDKLQASVNLSGAGADRWVAAVRAERRASRAGAGKKSK